MDLYIRWKQRFSNFKKTFNQLEKFLKKGTLNDLEEQGLIQAFEYTYELAWKTLQDLLHDKGFKNIFGPKPVIRKSFNIGLIDYGKGWLVMHDSRNMATHTYEQSIAQIIGNDIRKSFFGLFKSLKSRLEKE